MAIELVRRQLCDACQIEGEQADGETIAVRSVPHHADGAVELCARHMDRLGIAGLLDLVREHGRPMADDEPAAPGPKRQTRPSKHSKHGHAYPSSVGPFVCFACWEEYAHAASLAAHIENAHGLPSTPGVYEWLPTNQCPLCGEEFKLGRGLSRHAGAAHGVNLTRVFAQAREAGDPHGVVATLRSVGDLRAAGVGHYARA